MAVLLETSLGNLVIDLHVHDCPVTTKNFLKLCKVHYFDNVLFFNVQKDFIAQTGDPTGTGRGGTSIFGYSTRAAVVNAGAGRWLTLSAVPPAQQAVRRPGAIHGRRDPEAPEA